MTFLLLIVYFQLSNWSKFMNIAHCSQRLKKRKKEKKISYFLKPPKIKISEWYNKVTSEAIPYFKDKTL